MNKLFKLFERLSRFFLSIIPMFYKRGHRFQNKNQVTNTLLILSLIKNKIDFNFILDIGCGHGEWFLKCNTFFPTSNYLLFDANNLNKDKLETLKKKYNNINYTICLLSDKIKDLDFFNMGYGSSVYEENTNYKRYVEKLKSTTLEIELKRFKITNLNNLIKLDVQGSELDILKGLNEQIYKFEVIILETSLKQYNKKSPLFFEIINFMNSKDFVFYDLCDLKRLGKEAVLVQFDAVFVRKGSSLLNFNFV